jgi:hypothetical protein
VSYKATGSLVCLWKNIFLYFLKTL